LAAEPPVRERLADTITQARVSEMTEKKTT
jgi:hypothetical protein